MQETSAPTCASFSLHPSLSIFPFLAASLHSHMSSLNTMLSGFLTSWCLCLPHKLWLKTNMTVCVRVNAALRGPAYVCNWQREDTLVGPPNFITMSLAEAENECGYLWGMQSNILFSIGFQILQTRLSIRPALRHSRELFCRMLHWSKICRKSFCWWGWKKKEERKSRSL